MKLLLAAATAATVLSTPCFAQGTMYLLDSSRAIYTVDLETAVKTQVGTVSAGGTVGGLAYDCTTGTMFMTSTSTDTLYTLNLTTFTATAVGGFTGVVVMHGLEYDRISDVLYGGSDGSLYTIDRNTGVATVVGASGFTSFLNLGHHSGRDVMYATSSTTDSWYSIDRSTGAATLIGPLTGLSNPHGLAYVPHTDTMYLVDSSTDTLYSVNVDTGVPTTLGALGSGNYLGLAWVPDTCGTPALDARVTLAAPASCSVAPGAQGTFVATAINAGTSPVTNATVTFTMPAGATFVSSVPAAAPVGNTVTANLGGLAPSASAELSVTMTLNNLGTNTGQASVAISETDEQPANNNRNASTHVSLGPPASAAARALLSNIAGQANADVPGSPGQHFSTTGFDRPFRSPDGSLFVLTADTDFATTSADQVMLVGNASDEIVVGAREGQTGPDGANWGTFDTVMGVNDSGQFVFSNNNTGATTADEVVVKWDGTQFLNMITEGQAIPASAWVWGTTNGSATIQNDGTVSVQSNFTGATTATDTGVFRANGNTLVAQEGVTIPAGQLNAFSVKAFDTGTTDGQGFFLNADGSRHIWSGTTNDITAQDKVVVVDGNVVIQETVILAGSSFTSPVSTVLYSHMESNGDWFAYGANADAGDYAVRNGVVIGSNGSPIAIGATENWSDALFAQTFFLLAGNHNGDYVVGGTTDASNLLANAAIVLNGETVILRENDPVDLDNDGTFDDAVNVRTIRDDFGFLSNTHLYVVVTLRDGATALGCSVADLDLGQALIRVPLPPTGPVCGSADFDGDGDTGTDADIEAFFACLAGNCCATCETADFDGDGDTGTDADIEAFFRVLAGGTC